MVINNQHDNQHVRLELFGDSEVEMAMGRHVGQVVIKSEYDDVVVVFEWL